MTDLLIIGKGPAGWSCAMTARMRGLTAAVAAPEEGGSLLASAEKVENYPGLPHCSGKELLARFREQALALGAEEISGLVRRISLAGKSFYALCENDVMEAKAVLIATGAARPVLLPGEEELLGSGVSYCATCDGMFYRGKAVSVISGGDTGVKEAEFLAGIAGSVDFYRLPKGKKIRKTPLYGMKSLFPSRGKTGRSFCVPTPGIAPMTVCSCSGPRCRCIC